MHAIKNIIAKIKSIKNIEIIIAIIICLIILCIYLYSGSSSVSADIDEYEQYIMQLEDRVTELVCAIEGVDSAVVAISYDGSMLYEYVYDYQSTTNGDEVYTSSELVLVDGQPLLIRQVSPAIVGVVVVTDGTDSAIVDMYVLQAVTTLLDIDSSKVKII